MQETHYYKDSNIHILSVPERLSVLETEIKNMRDDHKQIMDKIDSLLEFKHKGLGGLALLTAFLGTGILGFVYSLGQFFKVH